MILPKMLVNWRGMFLVRHSLYNPSFCSDSTNTDSYRFFVIYFVLHMCVFFRFKILFFHNRWFWLRMCQKKKFLFPLCLNAMKRLWFAATTQVFLAFSSIPGNLHRKFLFFNTCICAMLAQSISHYCNSAARIWWH